MYYWLAWNSETQLPVKCVGYHSWLLLNLDKTEPFNVPWTDDEKKYPKIISQSESQEKFFHDPHNNI